MTVARTAYVPRWVKVEGKTSLCDRCGRLVEVAWRWYATPTASTWAFCEACAEQLLEEAK